MGIFEIVGRLPSTFRNVGSHPIDEVEELAVPDLGVKDRLNLKFQESVHVERGRSGHDAAGEHVGDIVESILRKCRLLHLNGYASVTTCSCTRIDQ